MIHRSYSELTLGESSYTYVLGGLQVGSRGPGLVEDAWLRWGYAVGLEFVVELVPFVVVPVVHWWEVLG